MKYNLSFVNYQELSFIHLVWAQPKTNLFLRMQNVCEAQVSRYVVKSKCCTLQIVRQERKKLHSADHQTELGPTFLFIVFTIGNCHYLPLISQLQHGAQNLSWKWWGRNPPWLTKVIDILLTFRTSGIIPPPPFTKAFFSSMPMILELHAVQSSKDLLLQWHYYNKLLQMDAASSKRTVL